MSPSTTSTPARPTRSSGSSERSRSTGSTGSSSPPARRGRTSRSSRRRSARRASTPTSSRWPTSATSALGPHQGPEPATAKARTWCAWPWPGPRLLEPLHKDDAGRHARRARHRRRRRRHDRGARARRPGLRVCLVEREKAAWRRRPLATTRGDRLARDELEQRLANPHRGADRDGRAEVDSASSATSRPRSSDDSRAAADRARRDDRRDRRTRVPRADYGLGAQPERRDAGRPERCHAKTTRRGRSRRPS